MGFYRRKRSELSWALLKYYKTRNRHVHESLARNWDSESVGRKDRLDWGAEKPRAVAG